MGDSKAPIPAQVRAARALLGWTQGELAARAGIGKQTVVRFEGGGHAPISSVVEAIRATLVAAGVEFIPQGGASAVGGGAGVRLRANIDPQDDEASDGEAPDV
jgi:transcriptional regulator with XRE-family HTH domain